MTFVQLSKSFVLLYFFWMDVFGESTVVLTSAGSDVPSALRNCQLVIADSKGRQGSWCIELEIIESRGTWQNVSWGKGKVVTLWIGIMHSFNALLSTSSTLQAFNAASAESTSSPPKVSAILDSPYQYIVNRNVNQLDSKSNESHNQKSNPHSSWNVNELYRHQSAQYTREEGIGGTFSAWFCTSVEEECAVFDKVAGDIQQFFQLVRHRDGITRKCDVVDFGKFAMVGRWVRVRNCLQLCRFLSLAIFHHVSH
jgi:hypothetical protein